MRKWIIAAVTMTALSPGILGTPGIAEAQTPPARVTFQQAIDRAIQNNPSVAVAAAGILRADALLNEARSAVRPQVGATVASTTLNAGSSFEGITVTPQEAVSGSLNASMLLYAPALWARRVQAADSKQISQLNETDIKRQIADATAEAFLAIVASHRVVDANIRARDTAKAHFDFATQLEQGGTGSKLNRLRAQQEMSTDDSAVESAQLAVYRAEEALAVLLVADGPVDAADEPALDVPPGVDFSAAGLLGSRTDLKLFSFESQAAQRILNDSRKDYYPTLSAALQPTETQPSSIFSPAFSARFVVQLNVSIFDGGQRSGQRGERQSALDVANANLKSGTNQASSEVRVAREAVASADRALTSTKAAADQAKQVLDIVNISFRAGASTNIEVIDAERTARDADTAVAVAEDTLRRAKLDLLIALGRFPA